MATPEAAWNQPQAEIEHEPMGEVKRAEAEVSGSVRNDCSRAVLERVRAMQWLTSAPDRSTSLERQRDIAKPCNVSIRQVQRLIRAWETSGVTGLERKGRFGETALR